MPGVTTACCLQLLLLVAVGGFAAEYPAKTVRVICPWSAGGGTDRVSRYWAAALEEEFDQPFVVINRTGGAGAVGHFAGAYAKPDGHTIAMITFELSTMHRMKISRLTYQDYECLLQVNADPAAVVVATSAPWETLTEFLAAVRGSPGSLKMSGTATGGAWDLARAGLLRQADLPIDAVAWVPHPGAAPSLMELLGGHVDAVCCSVPEVAAQLVAGQVRVLAVMAEERLQDYPALPTAKEQGVDWVAVGWRGLALPKGTPPAIVHQLEQVCLKIAASEEYHQFMRNNGFGIAIRPTAEFRAFLHSQDAQWEEVVAAAGYDRGLTDNHDPGPLALPALLLVGMAFTAAWEIYRGRLARPPAAGSESLAENDGLPAGETLSPPPAVAALLAVSLALVAYVVAIVWIGFGVSTLCFVSVTTWLLGAKWWEALTAAVLMVATVWLLFVLVFEVQLPSGLFELPI